MPPKNAAKGAAAAEGEEGDTAGDPQTHLAMLIASTFANDELESKRQTLAQYHELSARQKEENTRLREEMVERDRDSLQVVDFLRREVEKKQEQVETLKTQMEDQKEKAADVLRDRQEELQSALAVKEKIFEDKEATIRRLEEELEAVARHKRDKHEMEALVAELRTELDQTKEKYERELSRLRFQSLEEKVRLKHQEKGLTEKFDRAVSQKAMELLDGRTRHIHAEYSELRAHHQKLEKEYMALSKQSKRLEEEKKKKEREIELGKQSIDEYSKLNYRSHKEIRSLTARTAQLEANAARLVRELEEDKQGAVQAKEEETKELHTRLKEAEHALKIRTMELFRLRRLARVILQQRSELETFFTEALQHVKEQKAAETKRPLRLSSQRGAAATFVSGDFRPVVTEHADTGKLATPLPPISAGSAVVTPCTAPAQNNAPPPTDPHAAPLPDRVDISELSWEDKERVLRILFSKIATAQGRPTAAGGSGGSPTPSPSRTPETNYIEEANTLA